MNGRRRPLRKGLVPREHERESPRFKRPSTEAVMGISRAGANTTNTSAGRHRGSRRPLEPGRHVR